MESDYETETSLESSDTSYSYETSDDEYERPNSGFDGDPERDRKARGYTIVLLSCMLYLHYDLYCSHRAYIRGMVH